MKWSAKEKQQMLGRIKAQFKDVTFVKVLLKKTPDFVKYLSTKLGWRKAPFEVVSAKDVEGGEVNLIFAYDLLKSGRPTLSTQICIKKYLPFRRTMIDYEFSSDAVDRGFYEFQFSKLFRHHLANCDEANALEAICFNKHYNCLIMEKVNENMVEYDKCMIDESRSLRVSQNLGKALAIIQNSTYNTTLRWYRPLIAFEHLEQRCRKAHEIALRNPLFAKSFSKFLEESKGARKCMIHDSFCPKNIFVGTTNDNILIYDFEFSNYGDPAWDPGYMMAHFVTKLISSKERKEFFGKLGKTFFKSYERNILKFKEEFPDISKRMTGSIGVALIHRSRTLSEGQSSRRLTSLLAYIGTLVFESELLSPIDLINIAEDKSQPLS